MLNEIIFIALLIILATICFAAGQWSREQDEKPEYATVRNLNGHISEDTNEHDELSKKIAILENDYFIRYPCEYRKETEIGIKHSIYYTSYQNLPACHYPRPEGGYVWEKDMLSKCAKCMLRKEPSTLEDIEGC